MRKLIPAAAVLFALVVLVVAVAVVSATKHHSAAAAHARAIVTQDGVPGGHGTGRLRHQAPLGCGGTRTRNRHTGWRPRRPWNGRLPAGVVQHHRCRRSVRARRRRQARRAVLLRRLVRRVRPRGASPRPPPASGRVARAAGGRQPRPERLGRRAAGLPPPGRNPALPVRVELRRLPGPPVERERLDTTIVFDARGRIVFRDAVPTDLPTLRSAFRKAGLT